MYIAMNRFKIAPGREPEFEAIWLKRKSRLSEMAGFVEFRLLRGATSQSETLYATHTLWRNYEDFSTWTKSEQFRDAHKNAGDGSLRGIILGHPQFEGFETVLTEKNGTHETVAAE